MLIAVTARCLPDSLRNLDFWSNAKTQRQNRVTVGSSARFFNWTKLICAEHINATDKDPRQINVSIVLEDRWIGRQFYQPRYLLHEDAVFTCHFKGARTYVPVSCTSCSCQDVAGAGCGDSGGPLFVMDTQAATVLLHGRLSSDSEPKTSQDGRC